MNVIELQRALKHLRLGGMAAVGAGTDPMTLLGGKPDEQRQAGKVRVSAMYGPLAVAITPQHCPGLKNRFFCVREAVPRVHTQDGFNRRKLMDFRAIRQYSSRR